MKTLCMALMLSGWLLPAFALDFTYSPTQPTLDDTVEIELQNCPQGGVLHWGVNPTGNRWQQPIEVYRPPESTLDGNAVNTHFPGPDENGKCHIQLGPFNKEEQPVRSVVFAIQWADGTWSNNDGKDYQVPISFGRITFTPLQPTLNDRIVVTIHRNESGAQLRWGVNAINDMWQPPDKIYWPHGTVPSDDGLAVDSPIDRPDASGNSVIELGPFDHADQVVTSLHTAVHWDKTWDTDAGRNYNIEISLTSGPLAPAVSIVSPTNEEAVVDALNVVLDLQRATNVDLRLDGETLAPKSEPPYEWPLPFEHLSYGQHHMLARAANTNGIGMQNITFWRVPPYKVESLPAGTSWGTTVHDDGTVTFTLFAPGKRFVSLVGDFNQTNFLADVMNFSPDGTWWIRRAMEPGVHQYQFCIEGRMFLADPYAHDIEWKDEHGDEGYQPWDAKAVLKIGQPEYVWQTTNFVRTPLENLVVYEFHIDDLCPGQGFTGAISKLDYIKELGCTAIGPLPITEFTKASSWGYNPAFHMAPESAYGTPDDFKRLIDEAHRRGLAVIMDMVFNHMDKSSPLYQLYGNDYESSPYFRRFAGENWGFPDLNQQSKAVKRYEADALRHWLEEFHVDGFRFDATRFVEWHGYNDWGASWLAWAAKQADPQSFQISEHMPSDPELINTTEMDTTWHEHFRWRLRDMIQLGYVDRAEFSRIMDPRLIGYTNSMERMAYTESHDEDRVMRELQQAGYGREETIRRAETALALTLTAPGSAMIYAGQEFGENTPKVVGHNPIQWKLLRQPGNQELYINAGKLIRLRTHNPALQTENITIQEQNLPADTVAFARTAEHAGVVVAANLGKNPQTVPVQFPWPGTWNDVLRGTNVDVGAEATFMIQIEAGGVVVLSAEKNL